jgi:hypothetical protein
MDDRADMSVLAPLRATRNGSASSQPTKFAPVQAVDFPRLVPPDFTDDLSVYPSDFPIADRSPYSYAVDMGVVRSEFSAGNSRQRRAYTIMPHVISLVFHMRVEDSYVWQTWINGNAYTFFHCPVSTMYAGEPPDNTNLRYEILRFTSDLAVTMDGWDWVGFTVAAELSNDAHSTAPPVALGGWIVGGQPPAPSSDLFIGGTPAAPSVAWVLAGTPSAPSSF